MVALKDDDQITMMKEAGYILCQAHQIAKDMLRPGITTASIDKEVDKYIVSRNSIPIFKTVKSETYFPGAVCTSINEQVVHGIPGPYRLKEGDILSLDIGLQYKGWCADSAMTYGIGKIDADSEKLLDVTRKVLDLAIQELVIGRWWSSIALKMGQYVEKAGFSSIRELSGHGIGKGLQEDPQVPNYYTKAFNDFKIEPGLVIAIEPMVAAGNSAIIMLPDMCTIATKDISLCAHFEHRVAITKEGPIVLTSGSSC